ncbi:MAG: hypothetical protein ACK6DM_09905 [Alphaproteobacteria bacterium]|jgi:hypothetical protein
MRRAIGFLGTVLLMMLIFGLYTGVHEVKQQEKMLKELDLKIAQEAENIRVLKADWSYFNQSERLEDLVRQRLKLMPTSPGQIVIMANLPERGAVEKPGVKTVQPSDLPFRETGSGAPVEGSSVPSKGPTTQVAP